LSIYQTHGGHGLRIKRQQFWNSQSVKPNQSNRVHGFLWRWQNTVQSRSGHVEVARTESQCFPVQNLPKHRNITSTTLCVRTQQSATEEEEKDDEERSERVASSMQVPCRRPTLARWPVMISQQNQKHISSTDVMVKLARAKLN
jgi:hypothetical protein